MKTVQKLEIGFGTATFVSTLAYFYAYMLPHTKFVYDNDGVFKSVGVLLTAAAILLLPGAATAVGACIWSARANWLGFGSAVVGGAITVFAHLVLVAGVRFYSSGRITTLLLLTPLIFPSLTIIFAFRWRKILLSQDKGFVSS